MNVCSCGRLRWSKANCVACSGIPRFQSLFSSREGYCELAEPTRLCCSETFHHCYEQVAQGKKEHAKALHLVADCAKFCNLSSDLVANGSPLMAHACAACTEACKACAAECDKFGATEMKDCAKLCHACEKTCLAMVQAMGGHKQSSGE
jgi:hypothetical protein